MEKSDYSTVRYVISLGSNAKMATDNIIIAINWLERSFAVTGVSEVYETVAVGNAKGPYVNSVVVLESELTVSLLDQKLKEFELANGRDENARSRGLVPIDLDIVIAGSDILRPWEYAQLFFQKGFNQIK